MSSNSIQTSLYQSPSNFYSHSSTPMTPPREESNPHTRSNTNDSEMEGVIFAMGQAKVSEDNGMSAENANVDGDDEAEHGVPLPVNTNDDDASDFYPSDAADDLPTRTGLNKTTLARYQGRIKMLLNCWHDMGFGNVPPGFFWLAKLWKLNEETGHWTPKGPIMVVLDLGNEHRPGPVLFAHYMYGTKSHAFSFKIWEHFNHFVGSVKQRTVYITTAGHLGVPDTLHRFTTVPLHCVTKAPLDPSNAQLPITWVDTEVRMVPEPKGHNTIFAIKFLNQHDHQAFLNALSNAMRNVTETAFHQRLQTFVHIHSLSDSEKQALARKGIIFIADHVPGRSYFRYEITNTSSTSIPDTISISISEETGGPEIDTLQTYVAVKEYKPVKKDELEVNVGDEITPQLIFIDGMSHGFNKTTNKIGVFPISCLGIQQSRPSSPTFNDVDEINTNNRATSVSKALIPPDQAIEILSNSLSIERRLHYFQNLLKSSTTNASDPVILQSVNTLSTQESVVVDPPRSPPTKFEIPESAATMAGIPESLMGRRESVQMRAKAAWRMLRNDWRDIVKAELQTRFEESQGERYVPLREAPQQKFDIWQFVSDNFRT
ncbi:hypothetical protein HK098_001925 [Nowakowskiella sp. JEL0407]|nr:hypothetical protein HK098_001925 [Nowakowskiella sp. JEL0407]